MKFIIRKKFETDNRLFCSLILIVFSFSVAEPPTVVITTERSNRDTAASSNNHSFPRSFAINVPANAGNSSEGKYQPAMTFQYRGDLYANNDPIEMAQVQPHEPEPVRPSLPSYSDEDPSESHITLHQAARDGRADIVQQRIDKLQKRSRASTVAKVLDKRDEKRTTALHYAVRYGHVEVAKKLVEAGASFSREGEDGATAVHYAARFRAIRLKPSASHTNFCDVALLTAPSLNATSVLNTDSVDGADESLIKYFVDRGADINCQDKYGWTPLHFAASKRNIVACSEVLGVKGISVDLRDTSGQTPLHIAANEGDHELTSALLKAGADPRAKDNEKKTPLHFAALEGKLSVAVKLLNEVESQPVEDAVHDAVNDRNSQNETVLHSAVEGGHLPLVKLCLEKGANVRAVRNNLAQPLHLAAINGHVEIAELLIEHKAKIDARNNHHETPLHKAAFFNRFRMVEFLLSEGKANIECCNKDNLTPLLMAAVEGHTQLVKILLDNGASMSATDVYEETAIFLAAQENNVPTLKVLLEHPDAKDLVDASDLYENTPLHIACTKGYSPVATLLLDHGAQIDARNEDEHTPLHLAAKHGKVRCLKELLKRDASLLNDEDEASNTTLHLAALDGQVKCVRELLEQGAEVDARNNLLWTPLDCAAAKGHVKTAEVLLEYDAPVDPIDKAKTTPLHLASTEGHAKLVKLLLSKGADISLTDHTGRNCLDMAIDHGHKDCAALIIEDENWMDAMQSKTVEGGIATTPMRKLICKLPDVAELVFTKCVTDNGKRMDHPYYEIRLNYELLEDVYADWCQLSGSDTTSVHSLDMEGGENDDFYHSIRGEREEEKATRQLEAKANHPLILMVNAKREHLLSHPLVTFLLLYKWRTFGRYVYYIKLLMYCLFLFFLTAFAVYTTQHLPQNVGGINGTSEPSCDRNSVDYKLWVSSGKWIIFFLALGHIIIEIFQLVYQRRQYFVLENLLEWLVFVLAIVYVAAELNLEWFATNQSCWSEQQSIGAVSIFLAWTNLVLFIRKFPLLGIYVVMFTDILRTFLKFSLIFVLFIVSFALSFYTLLSSSQKEFKNPGRSIVKTVVMMIGEFDFGNIFYPESNMDVPHVTWVLFVLFVIVVTLLLMNLLIGLAVDDIKGVQEQAVLTRHAMQVDLALDVEKALPRKLRKRLVRTYETIQPNQLHGLTAYFNPAAISPKELRAALNPERTHMEKLELQNDALRESVTSIKSRIKAIQTTQDELVMMVKAMVEKLDVSVEDGSEEGEMF